MAIEMTNDRTFAGDIFRAVEKALRKQDVLIVYRQATAFAADWGLLADLMLVYCRDFALGEFLQGRDKLQPMLDDALAAAKSATIVNDGATGWRLKIGFDDRSSVYFDGNRAWCEAAVAKLPHGLLQETRS